MVHLAERRRALLRAALSTCSNAAVLRYPIASCALLVACERGAAEPEGTRPASSARRATEQVAGRPSASSSASGAAPVASGAPTRAAPPATDPTGPGSAAPVPPPGSSLQTEGRIEVLEAGAEPRAVLRYEHRKGVKQDVDVVLGSTLTMELSGFRNPTQTMPDVRLTMSVEIVDVDGAGVARRRLRIEGVSLVDESKKDDPMARGVLEQLRGVSGLTGSDRVDRQGRVLDSALDPHAEGAARGAMDTTHRTLAQMGVALPEEAVGKGARWAVTSDVTQFGVALTQVATYQLTERAGKKAKLVVNIEQDRPRGQFDVPGVPKATFSELESMKTKGQGTVELDLTKPVPKGGLALGIEARARGEMRGTPTSVRAIVTYRSRFEPR